jgi:hypothetical protein
VRVRRRLIALKRVPIVVSESEWGTIRSSGTRIVSIVSVGAGGVLVCICGSFIC